MAELQTVVVLDTGSGVTKAGFSGEDTPRAVFPSVVGRPRNQAPSKPATDQRFVGSDALNKRGVLAIKYPIECGVITNWDDWESLCHHTFHEELGVNMEEHGVLYVDGAIMPRANREKVIQVMFETFNVPSAYVAVDAAMSLLQSGRTTGVVLETGDGATHTVPIYEGYCLRYSVGHTPMVGRSVTDYMGKLLNSERGCDFRTSADWITVRDIKEKLSYVALDFTEELQTGSDRRSIEKSYELPDGQMITLENERFRCPESLFQPNLCGFEMPGVHEILHNSIMKCDPDLRKDMYANIVLSGGNVSFSGFTERMSKEMTNLAPNTMEVRVSNKSSVVKYPAWSGGSILASSSNFLDMCMSKDEYDEYGPALVHKKCLL